MSRQIDADALEKDLRAYADRKHNNGQTELANGILKAISRVKAAPTIQQPEWISCATRLPNDEECNAFETRWAEYPNFLVMIKGAELPTTLFYDWRTKEWFERHYDNTTTVYKVSCWMTMPQPPKEGE